MVQLRTLPSLALIAFLGVASAACSSSTDDDAGGAKANTFTSQSGALEVAVTTPTGDQPKVGMNVILYHVTGTSDHHPVDGLELEMTPFMPSMGHGSPMLPTVQALGDGDYRFENVRLGMAGLWELRTTIGGPVSDFVAPRFELE